MLKDYRQHDIADRVHRMEAYPLDVMLLGATGTGKSTTINAILGVSSKLCIRFFLRYFGKSIRIPHVEVA